MSELSNPQFQSTNAADNIKVEKIAPLGELAVGGGSVSAQFLLTSLCILDDPNLNHYFLVNQVKLQDRLTKTRIFPRDGMALPNGEVYTSPQPEEESNNASQ